MNGDDHEALVQASVRLMQDGDAPERVHENARQFFAQMHLAEEHVEALAGVGAKRLLLYRKLVRNSVRGAIRKLIPRTAARLGDGFDIWVERYCDEEMPRSHCFRDVASEFVSWVVPHWLVDSTIPEYLVDLARWEIFEFQVAIAMAEKRDVCGNELNLDSSVVFESSVRLAHFDHAVQRLADDEMDREEPVKESAWVLAYRDSAYEVQCLELNELAAGIVARLLAGKKFGAAVTEAFGDVPPASVLESIAQMLGDLAERNVLLGQG